MVICMNYLDILNSDYFKETYSKIENMKKDFPVNHGFIHVKNVINNAIRIADVFMLNSDEKRLLLIACALHDIGYLEGRDNHALNGSFLARKFLEEKEFGVHEIDIVCNAIKNHGGKDIRDFNDCVSMCLVIADKLDFVSSRYNENMLDEDKKKIFPHIIDTYITIEEYIVLNIVVDNLFSYSLFEDGSYFRKLNEFMSLLSSAVEKKYKIKYVCKD